MNQAGCVDDQIMSAREWTRIPEQDTRTRTTTNVRRKRNVRAVPDLFPPFIDLLVSSKRR
jgi:hypothetical protein